MVQNAGPVQATFAGPRLTASPNAVGKATVHADLRTLSGEASLRIHLEEGHRRRRCTHRCRREVRPAPIDPTRKPDDRLPVRRRDGAAEHERDRVALPAGRRQRPLRARREGLAPRPSRVLPVHGGRRRLRLRAGRDRVGHRRVGRSRRRPALDHSARHEQGGRRRGRRLRRADHRVRRGGHPRRPLLLERRRRRDDALRVRRQRPEGRDVHERPEGRRGAVRRLPCALARRRAHLARPGHPGARCLQGLRRRDASRWSSRRAERPAAAARTSSRSRPTRSSSWSRTA